MTIKVMQQRNAKSGMAVQSPAESAFERATISMRLRGAEIPVDTTATLKRARLKSLARNLCSKTSRRRAA